MSAIQQLRDMLVTLQETEAEVAKAAIFAYRKKVERERVPAKSNAYDAFMASQGTDAPFTVQDIIDAGVSKSRAYHRLKQDVSLGVVCVVEEGRGGRYPITPTYKKVV